MELADILFCEDIRFEQNNKVSLMGLYSDQIIFPFEIKQPIVTNLALLLRFKIEPSTKKLPDSFDFSYLLKDKQIAKIEGAINIDENESTFSLAILTPHMPIELGDIGFQLNLYKEEQLVFSNENKNAIKIVSKP